MKEIKINRFGQKRFILDNHILDEEFIFQVLNNFLSVKNNDTTGILLQNDMYICKYKGKPSKLFDFIYKKNLKYKPECLK